MHRHLICALVAIALSLPGRTTVAQTLPGALVYSTPGGLIADNAVTTFTFVVDAPGAFPVSGGITVRFRDFVDQAAGDIFAFLSYSAPGESSITRSARLFDVAPGGYASRAFDGAYSFGAFPLGLPGGLVPSGDFASAESLTDAFAGGQIAGTYRVHVYDFFSNGGASVGALDLAFDVGATSTVPEPSSLALLAAGLCLVLGVSQRRRVSRMRHRE